jgi:hypothetical protein
MSELFQSKLFLSKLLFLSSSWLSEKIFLKQKNSNLFGSIASN